MYNRSIKPHCRYNRLGFFPRSCSLRSGGLLFILDLEFLKLPDMKLAPGIVVLFQIHTNRGILKKSLTLSDMGHYLHKKS